MISGPGIRAIVRTRMADRLSEYDGKMKEAVQAVNAIPSPFDQAVIGEDDEPGRKAILAAVEHLEDFAALMTEVDKVLLSER